MPKRKAVDEMSAEELYELAKKRQSQEAAEQREAVRAEIEELRSKRRETVARQKKELAAIDREIAKLQRQARGTTGGRRGGGQLSQKVLDVLSGRRRASTKEIRNALEQQGIDTSNLGQTLAYLKRKGRITSPERAVYSLAK